jgi:hypothetical protein
MWKLTVCALLLLTNCGQVQELQWDKTAVSIN